MLDFPPWKVWSIVGTILIGFLFAAPNFLTEQQAAQLPSWLPNKQLSLGLDLRGGSHLMLEASTDDVRKAKLEALEETVRSELRQVEGGAVAFTDLSTANGRLSLIVTDLTRLDAAVEALRKVTRPLSGLSGARDVEVTVVDGNKIVLTETDAGVAQSIDNAMAQAVEVIRKRIDELGTREPTIVRQGANRIVVQVPGLQDPSALKALLGKTA
ncbi:MAG: protein translocase subunit SecD, partial [Polymorphobacter sp.]